MAGRQIRSDRHFPADKLESLIDIALGLSLVLLYQDGPHKLVHDIVRRQGGELLVMLWTAETRGSSDPLFSRVRFLRVEHRASDEPRPHWIDLPGAFDNHQKRLEGELLRTLEKASDT
jgi:hypothetical protein